ncbi:MAG: glycosyltransferase [Proteobacteria bacterium]|nr:glycosyltransferase [Pseudomonadota bacterium]
MALISVIVPIFNGSRFLPHFFGSLNLALPANSQVILVDDGSTEPVFEAVPEIPHASEVIRLRNDDNLGYSAAVNRGFAASKGDYVIQLNTDLILDRDCIVEMINLLESRTKVGIVGSKLLFPTTDLVQHSGMGFGHHSKRHIYFQLPANHPLCCITRPIQIMTGATVAATRQVLDEIGPLDEDYFNCNEDIDHCLKAITRGYTNYVCSESVAYHWVSQSGPARFSKIRESEAIFWSRWGRRYEVDLDRFVEESIAHLLHSNSNLTGYQYDVLNLCRSNDELLVFTALEKYWPGIMSRMYHMRQFSNPGDTIWLTMVTPHWYQENPRPFIYVVDRYRQLSENRLWFRNRTRLVVEEVIVDLTGCAMTVSEFLSQPDIP